MYDRVRALKRFQSLSIEGVPAMGKINGSRAAVRKQQKQKHLGLVGSVGVLRWLGVTGVCGVFKIDKGVRGVKSETILLSSLVGLVVGLVVSVLGTWPAPGRPLSPPWLVMSTLPSAYDVKVDIISFPCKRVVRQRQRDPFIFPIGGHPRS